MTSKKVLITVGTTEFDQLVEGIDCDDFLEALQEAQYGHLVLQYGRGNYHPRYLTSHYATPTYGIQITAMAFTDKLVEEMRSADLIVGHAGAGTVLEAVTLQKPMIAVVNHTLQDNHQEELAKALLEYDYCLVASIAELPYHIRVKVNERYSSHAPKPSFPINNMRNFATLMDSLFDTNSS